LLRQNNAKKLKQADKSIKRGLAVHKNSHRLQWLFL